MPGPGKAHVGSGTAAGRIGPAWPARSRRLESEQLIIL
jgi:hypothetical protein